MDGWGGRGNDSLCSISAYASALHTYKKGWYFTYTV